MDSHDVTQKDVVQMGNELSDLRAMARSWEQMFEWIRVAERWRPTSVEKFNRGAKNEMEQKLSAAENSAGLIECTLADFRGKIKSLRAVTEAANVYVPPETPEIERPIHVPQKEPVPVKNERGSAGITVD